MKECKDEVFGIWADPERNDFAETNIPYHLTIELTGRCLGSCIYCYSSSEGATGHTFPVDRAYRLIDEAQKIGSKGIVWHGGDPVLHPNWYDFARYTRDKGLKNICIMPNPMSITPKTAKMLTEAEMDSVLVHIDTLNQEVYNQVHTNPRTLELKIRGYRNLLEAGYPPQQVIGVVTFTKPLVPVYEEIVDWFIDEMGAGMFIPCTFRTEGFARLEKYRRLEPSLSEYRWAFEYRARKLGNENLLRLGSADGKAICKNYILVKDDGDVVPCTFMQDKVVGNVHRESLADILARERDTLLFNFEIKGYCGKECDSRDICFGCRANALHFTGDIQASDPKCWHNPANKMEQLLV